jgi:hypothetical protein
VHVAPLAEGIAVISEACVIPLADEKNAACVRKLTEINVSALRRARLVLHFTEYLIKSNDEPHQKPHSVLVSRKATPGAPDFETINDYLGASRNLPPPDMAQNVLT